MPPVLNCTRRPRPTSSPRPFPWASIPFHAEAETWWSLAKADGESLYWIGRPWHGGGLPMNDFPLYEEIIQRLGLHPQWIYHWARDLELHAATRFARQIWPGPWAVELIVDLRLPSDWVLDLVNDHELSTEALWDSSLILWGVDYVKP